MHWSKRRERFRELLAAGGCVFPASVFDPISARIAADLGYETGMFAGSVASLTVLGAPDLIVLNQAEFAEQAYRINRAGELPLLCDADHGYGNALNVMRTVEELETAGVVALTIEDTELPASFGDGAARLVAIDEGIGKMRAALAARQDSALVIIGRTSAASMTGVDDAVRRIAAYQDAGVDMLMLVGVKTRADLEAIAAVARVPLMIGGTGPELIDADWLAALGVRVCLKGHQPFMAAVKAVYDTMLALRQGVAPGELKGLADSELMKQVTRDQDYRRWSREFLGG